MSTQNEQKSLPVEMTYDENQLLKTAVIVVTALANGDQLSVVMGIGKFKQLHEKIGEERGQAFFDRMTEHARATKPDNDEDDSSDLPPELAALLGGLDLGGN